MRKKGTKNRRKVVIEQIRGIYYIKEAVYSNCSYWPGRVIDKSSDKEYINTMIKELRYKVVGEILKIRGNK